MKKSNGIFDLFLDQLCPLLELNFTCCSFSLASGPRQYDFPPRGSLRLRLGRPLPISMGSSESKNDKSRVARATLAVLLFF